MIIFFATVIILYILFWPPMYFMGGKIETFFYNINLLERLDAKNVCWHKFEELDNGEILRCQKCGHTYVTYMAEY